MNPPAWIDNTCLLVFTVALILFTLWSAWRKQLIPVFFLGWFVITLAPVAPLKEHIMKYYLTLPTIGLAMLGGYAVSQLWRGTLPWKISAASLAGLYLLTSTPASWQSAVWWYRRSQAAKSLVRGVARARELHPDKTLLLAGVDDYLFWAAIGDGAFQVYGIDNVYMTPGSEAQIHLTPELGDLPGHVFPKELAVRGLERQADCSL